MSSSPWRSIRLIFVMLFVIIFVTGCVRIPVSEINIPEGSVRFTETVPGEIQGVWVSTANYLGRERSDGTQSISMVLLTQEKDQSEPVSQIVFPEDVVTIGGVEYSIAWITTFEDRPGESLLTPVSTSEASGAVSAAELEGDWKVIVGPYEDIMLFNDGNYITHLHANPFSEGTWQVDNNILYLEGGFPEELRVVEYSADSLTLQQSDGVQVKWERI